jgi:hypothetical protein
MKIITAGTKAFSAIIKAQANICRDFGYEHIAYDLGDLGFGVPFEVDPNDLKPQYFGNSLPAATFKPKLLIANLYPGETVCWLDGDCIPQEPFEPPDDLRAPGGLGKWDAAVTLRPLAEIGQCGIRAMDFLNAGVVWIRRRRFLDLWLAKSIAFSSDQDGLNLVVSDNHSKEAWAGLMNRFMISPYGFLISVLDCSVWNNWHLPPAPGTKIIHFKTGIRESAKNYIRGK